MSVNDRKMLLQRWNLHFIHRMRVTIYKELKETVIGSTDPREPKNKDGKPRSFADMIKGKAREIENLTNEIDELKVTLTESKQKVKNPVSISTILEEQSKA